MIFRQALCSVIFPQSNLQASYIYSLAAGIENKFGVMYNALPSQMLLRCPVRLHEHTNCFLEVMRFGRKGRSDKMFWTLWGGKQTGLGNSS